MERKLNGWCSHGVPGGVGCVECARRRAEEDEQTTNSRQMDEISFLEQLRDAYFKIRCDTYQSVGYKLLNDRIAQLRH